VVVEGVIGTMIQGSTPILLCDACVMLDYLDFAPNILSLTVKHLTQIFIPDVVLAELSKYSQSDIEALGKNSRNPCFLLPATFTRPSFLSR